MSDFDWKDPGLLLDDDLELILAERRPGYPLEERVPLYHFKMFQHGNPEQIGYIDLRIGNLAKLSLYCGHIAYEVYTGFRGKHYAARACRLLYTLAKEHGMNELWITCNPDNYASRRTSELAGAEFVEIIDLPEDIDMYLEGDRQKCRYRIQL